MKIDTIDPAYTVDDGNRQAKASSEAGVDVRRDPIPAADSRASDQLAKETNRGELTNEVVDAIL